MQSIVEATNRLPQAPPHDSLWESILERMASAANERMSAELEAVAQACRDQAEEEIAAAVQACRDQVLHEVAGLVAAAVDRAVAPLQKQIDLIAETLPELLKSAQPTIAVPAPTVTVQVPRRRTIKHFTYRDDGRPDAVIEEEA